MRFTRHSKNRARLYGLNIEDAETIVRRPQPGGFDRRGNPCYFGVVRGRRIRVVIALDDPATIITIHPLDD